MPEIRPLTRMVLPDGLRFLLLWARIQRLGLDHHVISARVISQIPFIHTQEQHAITLRNEIPRLADEDKVVVVVANHANQSAGRLVAHQLVTIGKAGDALRSRKAPATETHASIRGNPQPLAT